MTATHTHLTVTASVDVAHLHFAIAECALQLPFKQLSRRLLRLRGLHSDPQLGTWWPRRSRFWRLVERNVVPAEAAVSLHFSVCICCRVAR